nr:hypothetical protein [Tanacetum cinerariifolium]
MFIKLSTNQIPPKKSKGKGSKVKKTTEESQETINVSEEFEPKPKPAKKNTSSKRRVKKKVTLSADDNIISDDPYAALKLPKSISQTELEEAEATRKVHATHARIVTESIPESAKKKSSSRISKSVVIQDTPSTPMSKRTTLKTNLKVLHLLLYKNKKLQTSCMLLRKLRRQAEDNQEKDITKEKVILKWGVEQNSEFSDDDNDDVENDDKDSNADDEGNDHVSDTQDAEYEDVKTESDENNIYKYKICVARMRM